MFLVEGLPAIVLGLDEALSKTGFHPATEVGFTGEPAFVNVG